MHIHEMLKGQKLKSLRIVQKSFLDNKKFIVIFHLLGGGGGLKASLTVYKCLLLFVIFLW